MVMRPLCTDVDPSDHHRATAGGRRVLSMLSNPRVPGYREPVLPGTGHGKMSTLSGPRASQSHADVAQAAGPHPLSGTCAPSGQLLAGQRILLARRARMLRSAQTSPEVTPHSMIIKTWTSPPRTALGPRSLVIIYPRGHQGRSRKAWCPLGNRAQVTKSRAGLPSHHAAAWR